MIVFNFKNYEQGLYPKLNATLESIADISEPTHDAFFAVNGIAIAEAQKNFGKKLDIIGQSFEVAEYGASTGGTVLQSLLLLGVKGSLLNHSEKRLGIDSMNELLGNSIGLLSKIIDDNGLNGAGLSNKFTLVICVESVQDVQDLVLPRDSYTFLDFGIAYEPPELIGSGKSVTDYKVDEVKEFISVTCNKFDRCKKMIGAGVSKASDIIAGKELGAEGFLLASALFKGDVSANYLDLINADKYI